MWVVVIVDIGRWTITQMNKIHSLKRRKHTFELAKKSPWTSFDWGLFFTFAEVDALCVDCCDNHGKSKRNKK